MSETPTYNALVSAAVLHVFLAQHPELALLPIDWAFREGDGITAHLPTYHPDTVRVADLMAEILGATVTGPEYERDGERKLPRYINAELNGIPFFFSGLTRVGGAR